MNRTISVAARFVLAASLVVGLGACGGGSDTGTTPTAVATPTPAPQRQTLPAQTFSNLGPLEAAFADFTVTGSVNAEITANWTFASSDIDIFVTSTSCTTGSWSTLFNQVGACSSFIRGVSLSKPEVATGTLASGTYRAYVASSVLSVQTESGTLSISYTSN